MEELTYDELRKLQSREKNDSLLTELPQDFYENVRTFLEGWNTKLSGKFGLAEAKEYENILKILRDIYYKRQQKILFKALLVAKTGEDVDGLATGERELFGSILGSLKESDAYFDSLLSVQRAAHQMVEQQKIQTPKQVQPKFEKSVKRLKFSTEIPKFVGSDQMSYGPFNAGDEHELPNSEAELLLRKGVAQEI
ncbi:MAG: hypothetical protein ABIH99_01755 [Candidatus Micrarchaeota archaeon]